MQAYPYCECTATLAAGVQHSAEVVDAMILQNHNYASSSLMPTMARTAARIGQSAPSGTLGAIKLPATTRAGSPRRWPGLTR